MVSHQPNSQQVHALAFKPGSKYCRVNCVYVLPLLAQGSACAHCLADGRQHGRCAAFWCLSVSAEQLRLLLSSFRYMLQEDGKQLPGRKGISLPQEQFCKLEQHAQKLTAALRNQRLSFSFALSEK